MNSTNLPGGDQHRLFNPTSPNRDNFYAVLDGIRADRKDGETYGYRLERRDDFMRSMLFALAPYVHQVDWDYALEEGKKALDRARK